MTRLVPAVLLFSALVSPALAQDTAPPTGTPPAAAAAPPDGAAATHAAPAAAAAPAIDPEAPGGDYVLDQEHSAIVFSYDHLGSSTSRGIIRGVSGTITLDPAAPASSRVEVAFPLSAIQTVSRQLDEEMFGPDLFDGAAPATAVTFTSTAVEPTGPHTARVTGDLHLNDVTAPVTLDVTLRRLGKHPMTGQPAAGFDITGTLKRSDFGLGAFVPAIGDEVRLEISAEAAKG